jgi:beta-lactamase class A
MYSRRNFLLTAAGILTTIPALPALGFEDKTLSIPYIETKVGGRIGFFAIDTGSGRVLAYRADERFAMCSTFKLLLAATVLEQQEHNLLSLNERISYG